MARNSKVVEIEVQADRDRDYVRVLFCREHTAHAHKIRTTEGSHRVYRIANHDLVEVTEIEADRHGHMHVTVDVRALAGRREVL